MGNMRHLELMQELGMIHDIIVRRQMGGRTMYCVMSEDRSRSFGCYDTREAAVRRLGQIEFFKRRDQ